MESSGPGWCLPPLPIWRCWSVAFSRSTAISFMPEVKAFRLALPPPPTMVPSSTSTWSSPSAERKQRSSREMGPPGLSGALQGLCGPPSNKEDEDNYHLSNCAEPFTWIISFGFMTTPRWALSAPSLKCLDACLCSCILGGRSRAEEIRMTGSPRSSPGRGLSPFWGPSLSPRKTSQSPVANPQSKGFIIHGLKGTDWVKF